MIKENALKPFHVHVGDLITTVLGTTFNIRSFPDEEGQVEVSLVSGKIKVSLPVLKDENVLIPGEQAVYSKTRGKSQVKPFDIKEVTCWKEGILLFRNASFEQVKSKLEKWYGVEIHTFNQPGKAWNLNGEVENESIERVLERLAFMKNFTFQFKEKTVEIKF